MSKRKVNSMQKLNKEHQIDDVNEAQQFLPTQHNKGKIKDNAIKALVRSNIFRHKVFKNKKGKGSYNRQSFKNKDYNQNCNPCLLGIMFYIVLQFDYTFFNKLFVYLILINRNQFKFI